MKVITIVLLLTALCGCATKKQIPTPTFEEEVIRLRSLDMKHFRDTASIHDDPLELTAMITTSKSHSQYWPPSSPMQTDPFIRVYIDKKTQAKLFQVYMRINHYSGEWLFPYQANYGRPLRSSKVTRIDSDVDCGRRTCRYREDIAFNVEEEELRRMLTLSDEDIATKYWAFKLKTKSGKDILEGFNVNEILGLLDVVDKYKTIQTLE